MLPSLLIINGSASQNSSNEKLIAFIAPLFRKYFHVNIFSELKSLPHFDPQLSDNNPPAEIIRFRKLVEDAKGVIIVTPEYIFSIPSGLKNAIEWCVITTVFSDKPLSVITASLGGEKGHEELTMILRTLTAQLNDDTNLLISGVRKKISEKGEIIDEDTKQAVMQLVDAFVKRHA